MLGCSSSSDYDRAADCSAATATAILISSRLENIPPAVNDKISKAFSTFTERAAYEGKKIGMSLDQVSADIDDRQTKLTEIVASSDDMSEFEASITPCVDELDYS